MRLPILLGEYINSGHGQTGQYTFNQAHVSPISFLQHLPYIRFGDEGAREAHDGPLLYQMQGQLYYYSLDY